MKKNRLPKQAKANIGFVFFLFLFICTIPAAAQDTIPQSQDSVILLRDSIAWLQSNIHRLQDSLSGKSTPGPVILPSKVYKLNYLTTGIFSLAATAANLYAIPTIIHNKKDLTPQELQAANSRIFNGFDKWALQQDPSKRESYYKASDIFLPATVAVSAASFLLIKKTKKDWLKLLLMYYQMHAITFALYDFSFFGPAFQNKLRPIVYYPYFSEGDRIGGNQRNSLYSGHVASSVASTFFAVKVYCDYHPEIGGKKYLLYGLASIPPLVEGYLRVKALAHFPSDVMIGFVIGAVCGIAVPEAHRIKIPGVQLNAYSNGQRSGLRLCWNFNAKRNQKHTAYAFTSTTACLPNNNVVNK